MSDEDLSRFLHAGSSASRPLSASPARGPAAPPGADPSVLANAARYLQQRGAAPLDMGSGDDEPGPLGARPKSHRRQSMTLSSIRSAATSGKPGDTASAAPAPTASAGSNPFEEAKKMLLSGAAELSSLRTAAASDDLSHSALTGGSLSSAAPPATAAAGLSQSRGFASALQAAAGGTSASAAAPASSGGLSRSIGGYDMATGASSHPAPTSGTPSARDNFANLSAVVKAAIPPGGSGAAATMCENCEDNPATLFCAQCDVGQQKLCAECDGSLHRSGKPALHSRRPLASTAPSATPAPAPSSSPRPAGFGASAPAAAPAPVGRCEHCDQRPPTMLCSDCPAGQQRLCSECETAIHRAVRVSWHKRQQLPPSASSASAVSAPPAAGARPQQPSPMGRPDVVPSARPDSFMDRLSAAAVSDERPMRAPEPLGGGSGFGGSGGGSSGPNLAAALAGAAAAATTSGPTSHFAYGASSASTSYDQRAPASMAQRGGGGFGPSTSFESSSTGGGFASALASAAAGAVSSEPLRPPSGAGGFAAALASAAGSVTSDRPRDADADRYLGGSGGFASALASAAGRATSQPPEQRPPSFADALMAVGASASSSQVAPPQARRLAKCAGA
jgi:hypothetical protein